MRCRTGSCRSASKKPDPWIEAIGFAAKCHTEIETKSIDVERCYPIAQRIHHELEDARMG